MSEIKIKILQEDYNFKTTNNADDKNKNNTLFLNYIDEGNNDTYVTNENDIAEISEDYFKNKSTLEKTSEGYFQIEVQAWGSEAPEGLNEANDCLSRIIINYYPDIKPYSEEYNKLLEEICRINNINDSNIILTGDKLILPIPVRDPENNSLIGFFSPEPTKDTTVKEEEEEEAAAAKTETNDTTQKLDYENFDFATKEGLIEQEDGSFAVEVQAWGSEAPEGLRNANDCLSRIILNYYKGYIQLYTPEYNQLLDDIYKLNNIENPNFIRTGAKIILPPLGENFTTEETQEDTPAEETTALEDTPETETTIPEESQKTPGENLLKSLENNKDNYSAGLYSVMQEKINAVIKNIKKGFPPLNNNFSYLLNDGTRYSWEKQDNGTWILTIQDKNGKIKKEEYTADGVKTGFNNSGREENWVRLLLY